MLTISFHREREGLRGNKPRECENSLHRAALGQFLQASSARARADPLSQKYVVTHLMMMVSYELSCYPICTPPYSHSVPPNRLSGYQPQHMPRSAKSTGCTTCSSSNRLQNLRMSRFDLAPIGPSMRDSSVHQQQARTENDRFSSALVAQGR